MHVWFIADYTHRTKPSAFRHYNHDSTGWFENTLQLKPNAYSFKS